MMRDLLANSPDQKGGGSPSAVIFAAAQLAVVAGDYGANLREHLAFVTAARLLGVQFLIFPELSLTGYEPGRAAEWAIAANAEWLQPLATAAHNSLMTLVVGAPLHDKAEKPAIGAICFLPDGSRQTYRKMHLGGNEPNYFVAGDQSKALEVDGEVLGLAICADASRASHPANYATAGATVYAAGVFLTEEWYATDCPRLAGYAASERLLVMMANQADSTGSYRSVGRSAVWSPDGKLLAQASGTQRALVIARKTGGFWQGDVVPVAEMS